VNDYKRYAQRRDLPHLCSYPSACFEQTAVKRRSALPSEGTRELAGLYLSWWGPVWSSRPNQFWRSARSRRLVSGEHRSFRA
jgi:hypothetical protein